jgi:hypothetical protein
MTYALVGFGETLGTLWVWAPGLPEIPSPALAWREWYRTFSVRRFSPRRAKNDVQKKKKYHSAEG